MCRSGGDVIYESDLDDAVESAGPDSQEHKALVRDEIRRQVSEVMAPEIAGLGRLTMLG